MAGQATTKKSEAERRAGLPGKAVPFWIDSTPETDFPALDRNVSVDVAVIGGGMAGIITALLVKETGPRVARIEADRISRNAVGMLLPVSGAERRWAATASRAAGRLRDIRACFNTIPAEHRLAWPR